MYQRAVGIQLGFQRIAPCKQCRQRCAVHDGIAVGQIDACEERFQLSYTGIQFPEQVPGVLRGFLALLDKGVVCQSAFQGVDAAGVVCTRLQCFRKFHRGSSSCGNRFLLLFYHIL